MVDYNVIVQLVYLVEDGDLFKIFFINGYYIRKSGFIYGDNIVIVLMIGYYYIRFVGIKVWWVLDSDFQFQ